MDTNILKTLGCGEDEISVFVSLLSVSPASILELSKTTGIKRTTLYGIVSRLLSQGLIVELVKKDIKTYEPISKEKLELLYENKITELKDAKKGVGDLFGLAKRIPTSTPRLETYYGKDGVRYILEDMLLKRNIETEALWPIKTMVKVLGGEFFKHLNKERIKKNIYTRAIWPESQIIDTKVHPYLGSGDNFLREIRILPKEIDFEMGYWIYDDRVAFISSEKEMYGFIVQSRELTHMLRVQFELLWKLSKSLKQPDNPQIQNFLKEIYR